MIEIALRKWGYFDQITFNANKTAFDYSLNIVITDSLNVISLYIISVCMSD